MNRTLRTLCCLTVLLLPAMTGCKSIYYGTMEKLGYEKRELLVDRVEDARDQQERAKDQFTTALERFKGVVSFDGGDYEKMYDQLRQDYDRSKAMSDRVSSRIDDVQKVAKDLFAEWESELAEYENAQLREASQKQLDATRQRYEQMLAAMQKAKATMPPVLTAMHDQVLFLKHNLNAQAIASIQGTAEDIGREIQTLIQEMQKSIDEANKFIDEMGVK